MTQRLREEIMISLKLRNKLNKSRTSVNLQNYRKQRNKYKSSKKRKAAILSQFKFLRYYG